MFGGAVPITPSLSVGFPFRLDREPINRHYLRSLILDLQNIGQSCEPSFPFAAHCQECPRHDIIDYANV
jgi:hypothetical protein